MNDVKKVSDAEIGMNVTRLRENATLQAFEAYGLLQCLGFDPVKQAGILYLPHRKDNVQRLGEPCRLYGPSAGGVARLP